MAEHFLDSTGETRGGAPTTKQQLQIFLRYVGDPGFQVEVGEDIGIQQSTVSETNVSCLSHMFVGGSNEPSVDLSDIFQAIHGFQS